MLLASMEISVFFILLLSWPELLHDHSPCLTKYRCFCRGCLKGCTSKPRSGLLPASPSMLMYFAREKGFADGNHLMLGRLPLPTFWHHQKSLTEKPVQESLHFLQRIMWLCPEMQFRQTSWTQTLKNQGEREAGTRMQPPSETKVCMRCAESPAKLIWQFSGTS